MFNIISALVVTGVLSASGLALINDLEDHSKNVANEYATAAEKRFQEYESMLPGIVDWKSTDEAAK